MGDSTVTGQALVSPPTMPPTMRAWTHVTWGVPSSVLKLSSDVKTPAIKKPTEILVRVTYASLNPGGSIMMQLCPPMIRQKPAIPELDFSGVIVAVGSEVPKTRNLVPGCAVIGSVPVAAHIGGVGALAEYVSVDANCVVSKPDHVTLEQAAGLTVAGCTALALLDIAKLKKGDKVLVNGASGGIGTMTIELVRDLVGEGGIIVAICSGKNAEFVKKLGANEVINYQEHNPVHQHLAKHHSKQKFDVILDAYGIQDLYVNCAEYLKPGSKFVSVGVAHQQYTIPSVLYASLLMLKNTFLPRFMGNVDRPYHCAQGFVTLQAMESLAKLSEEGKLNVFVGSCWEMKDALKAYEIMLNRRARGKIIIKVQNP